MSNSQIPLADFLDLVDDVSLHQRALHRHLEVGFLALAREGYRNSASFIRIANAAPSKADSFLTNDGQLVMTKIGSTLAPVPSTELRGAIDAFRAALEEIVNLTEARRKVSNVKDENIIFRRDAENSDSGLAVSHSNKESENQTEDPTEGEGDNSGEEEVESIQDGGWTVVR